MANVLADRVREEDLFACFGYGSLVNRRTLSSSLLAVFPAKLKGWRRQWQARPCGQSTLSGNRSIALLSVRQDPECSIDGMMFIEHRKNLPSLKEREKFYNSHAIGAGDIVCENSDLRLIANKQIHIYAVPATSRDADAGFLLRSYLDVVMQGFLSEYGEPGLKRFIDTTDWRDLPVFEDREGPLYPRHQQLSLEEMTLFDSIIR